MVLSYATCCVPVASMRKDASHRSEQVSQLLFGERTEILQIKDEFWAFVRNYTDQYEGWCLLGQLNIVSKKDFLKLPKFLTINHSSILVTADATLQLPLGASIKSGSIELGGQKAKFKGKKVERTSLSPSATSVVMFAQLLRYAPYQWGGRTLQGIDCSGFSQLVFALSGIQIPRDAAQQALQGQAINFLQEAKCGDLAFFANNEGRINHVGMLLDENTIIHATETAGCVVVDKIDQEGIVSKLLRKRTHSLRLIKRYF